MKSIIEWGVYSIAVIGLSGLVVAEGVRNNELTAGLPLEGKELLRKISRSQQKIQILDTRAIAGDEGYEDVHIPGAIPFPGCDMGQAPESVRKQIMGFVPTVIVSQDGDRDIFSKCRTQFKNVRNLAGGMKVWVDEGRPEDSGDYTPPRAAAGGGCL